MGGTLYKLLDGFYLAGIGGYLRYTVKAGVTGNTHLRDTTFSEQFCGVLVLYEQAGELLQHPSAL